MAPPLLVSWSNLRLLSVVTSTSLPFCPSTAWSSLLSDQCHQRVILQPTTSTHQSSERNRLLICAKIGRIGKAHQLFLTWPAGQWGSVYVCMCASVCVCVLCVMSSACKRNWLYAWLLVGEHWTVLHRGTSSQTAPFTMWLYQGGHHQLSLSNQISVYPLNFSTVSHFDLPFLFLFSSFSFTKNRLEIKCHTFQALP